MPVASRLARILLAVGLTGAVSGACSAGRSAVRPPGAGPDIPVGTTAARGADPQDPATPAPSFALVAVGPVRLHRLLDGRVLSMASPRILYLLGRDGKAVWLGSLVEALHPTLGALGSIGGSWPGTLFVELYRITPSEQDSTSGLVVRGDLGRAEVVRTMGGEHLLAPISWRNGALLAMRVHGASDEFGTPIDRAGQFEVVGEGGGRPPMLPSGALLDDSFVAYPAGSVLALGGRRTTPVVEEDASDLEMDRGYMLDGALVWQSDASGGDLRAVQLPGTTARDRLLRGRLLSGRSETDTLVWGELQIWRNRRNTNEPYLARFTGTSWHRVPISAPIRAIAAGADGSVWAVRGGDDPDDATWLERLTLKADGGVGFVRIVLAPRPEWASLGEEADGLGNCKSLRPRELCVGDATDIWLTAGCASAEGPGPSVGPSVLLHTQAQGPLLAVDRDPTVPQP